MARRILAFAAIMLVAAMGDQRGSPIPPPVQIPRDAPEGTPAPAQARQPAPTIDLLEAAETAPAELLREARALVIFANNPADETFTSQIESLQRDPATLTSRDVVVIVDSDPDQGTEWRNRFRPSGFSLVLIDKDGTVIDRKPLPWSNREIARAIDKTPIRRDEVRRSGGG